MLTQAVVKKIVYRRTCGWSWVMF